MLARSKSAALLLITALAVPVTLFAQKAAEQQAPTHIHVIGASVSGGFEDGPLFGAKETGDSVSMHHMLRKWSGGEVKVTTHPPMEMCYTFSNPLKIGKKQIDGAKKRKADMIVAVDFPFWFAYGYVRKPEAKSRMDRLEVCLEYLAGLNVPVVIGDLPNMKGAARRMVSPKQIPSEEMLVQLNARLKKFAADNDKITIVPMSQIVKQLKVEGVLLPLKDGELKTAPCALLQGDKLHATRLGMALLTFTLQESLRQHFPKEHALRQQNWTFEEFVDAAGADDELDTLREAAQEKVKESAAKK